MVKKLMLLLLIVLLPLTAVAEYPLMGDDVESFFGDFSGQTGNEPVQPSGEGAVPQADPAVQVIDDAGILTPQMMARITSEADAIEREHDVDVVVLITRNTPYDGSYDLYRVAAFADQYYEDGGYGMGRDHSGILVVMDMRNRAMYLSTEGVMIDYIDDEREEIIFDRCAPYVRSDDWGGAALSAVQSIGGFMDEGRQKGVFRYDEVTGERLSGMYNPLEGYEILLAVFGGLAVAVIMTVAVRGVYSLEGRTYTYDLASKSTCNLTKDEETFLRQSVSRMARSSGSSGHSGGHSGGGRSGGSGVHRSSSGRSHGGGGRRF